MLRKALIINMKKPMTKKDQFKTGLGVFSKDKFKALTLVRANTLLAFREALRKRGFTEVTTASLVNIAGSCENPHASFTLNYYGKDAHLSQSAQLQLEALVMRLKQKFFTVNNSFREENYDDPDSKGRRLSEFTLIEPEKPFINQTPEKALSNIMKIEEEVVKEVVETLLLKNRQEIKLLGGDIGFLEKVLTAKFNVITYDEAIALINKANKNDKLKFGDDLAIKEERAILKHFHNTPTFVTHLPAEIKFFNMKRTPDGKRTHSVDLLLPSLGETTGGAVREEDGDVIAKQLKDSKIGKFLVSLQMVHFGGVQQQLKLHQLT